MFLIVLCGVLFAMTVKEAAVGWYVALACCALLDFLIGITKYGGSLLNRSNNGNSGNSNGGQ